MRTCPFIICLIASILFPFYTLAQKDIYIDSLINSMSLEEKIGQLIIIASDSKTNTAYIDKISKSIDELNIGGICFFKGEAKTMIELNKTYSKIAQIPLLFSIDGEWGLGMRMTDGYSFPRQISIGATDNDSLVYEMGKNIALQAKAMGIHINFAPCVDINQNPKNPVIGYRSFGEDKERVAKLAWAYAKGMQDNGVLGSLKHFPGHGDTEVDSHHDLPIINHSRAFIDSIDTYPFRYSINRGAKMVMIGHLNIPSLIPNPRLPSSLSKEVIDNYLRKELNFNGLVITDALNMSGVTKNYKNGEAEVLSLIAGVDILLMPKDEYKAVKAIIKAVKHKRLSKDDIDKKCRKVLELKYELDIFENNNKEISLPSNQLIDKAEEITEEISKSTITLIKNRNDNLPIIDRKNARIAIISLGSENISDFTKTIQKYNNARLYKLNTGESIQEILPELRDYDHIIAVICGNINKRENSNYGISNTTMDNLLAIEKDYNISLALFASPYSLEVFDKFEGINSIILGYQNTPSSQRALANSIFGLNGVEGRLPITSSNKYKVNHGLNYTPEKKAWLEYKENRIGISYLKKIDSIANNGILLKAYPGCQILIIDQDKIVYNKSYGYLTYDSIFPVNDSTIYDIASLTKALSTTLAMMKLYEEGKYKLDDRLSKHLPYLKHTNKKNINIKQTLAHNARLKSWVPFYKETIEEDKPNPNFYSFTTTKSIDHYTVCDSLSIKKEYSKEILKQIGKSQINRRPGYMYSDLGFILLGDMVEAISNNRLDKYILDNFYRPMELKHIGYNPRDRFTIDNIAPTENDNYFRKQLIRGYVHDQTSAMMGGVTGHAGLFSNAEDIGKLSLMLMNNGEYKGRQYLKKTTIETFNKMYFKDNRRSLGFDKPVNDPNIKYSPSSKYASEESYGHTGFTGTIFWVDPVEKIGFVFLSNRVYPSAEDNKLAKLDIRTNIHDIIYEAIRDYDLKNKESK